MKWTDANVRQDNSVALPPNWLFLHYYEALTVLFRIENTLRTFVYVILKDNHKTAWSTLTISTEDNAQTTIAAVAKKRLALDTTFGYLGYSIASPLMHLTSGELIRIILSEAYWPLFASYFPTTKQLVQTKLEEIGNVRNALAHFRPLKPDDVQVVRQNANQVLSRVDEVLSNLVSANAVVPTNTQDAWYTELTKIAHPNVLLEIRQSDDERWIKLGLRYDCPSVEDPTIYATYRGYRLLTVLTPPILQSSPAILEHIIFASEYVPYITVHGDSQPVFYKTVELLFSRTTFAERHQELVADLNAVLQKIGDETTLIQKDNLARGALVRAAWASASKREDQATWIYNMDALRSPTSPTDPTEYWAGKPLFGQDFLTNTESFPWMPVDVSNFSPPF